MIVHAGLVTLLHGGRWRGVLITGPSGAGKSDLALRLMEQGFMLVADDRTLLWTSGRGVYGRAPETLAGKIEARGLGILEMRRRDFAAVDLVVALDDADIERMPDSTTEDLLGRSVARIGLRPFEASAPAKLRRWLIALG
jgi:serine kinase of HPr protein (carbohydrate metabolism regulator)